MHKKLIPLVCLLILGPDIFAEVKIVGKGNTGEENTIIQLYEEEEMVFGKIIASDNAKVQLGTMMLKAFRYDGKYWRGQIFSLKKQNWFDAKIEAASNRLEIEIKAGFLKQKREWEKAKTSTDAPLPAP